MRKKEKINLPIVFAVSIVCVILLFVLVFVIFRNPKPTGEPAATQSEPKRSVSLDFASVRGVWIASVNNIDYPTKANLSADELSSELDDIVATAKEYSLNTIFFQVRPCADALYSSELFPQSAFVSSDRAESFDSLAYLIEKCRAENISVFAWINPLRVTAGSSYAPQHEISALPENSPARLHPEWVVAYANGQLYFDCGVPGVRTLVAEGAAELAASYDVAGIVFDDYFYPYPVTVKNDDGTEALAVFNDSATYDAYAADGQTLADWRRSNADALIEEVYRAVKSADSTCLFGVAPFGIWQNDNGSNNGTDTRGLESYNDIFCDPLAWVRGGYVDFLAPQLYWRHSDSFARFDVLFDWWKARLDNTGVALLISHGVYRYGEENGWESGCGEITRQLEYCRESPLYCGSVFYGYDEIKNNSGGAGEEIKNFYSEREK